MATFQTNAVGKVDDVVRLQLGNQDVLICESYQVHVGVLQQPANFTLRLGQGTSILPLIQANPPHTPFTLSIGGVPQFDGYTDGYEAEGSLGATELTLEGRDRSSELHVGEFQQQTSYNNLTYQQLAQAMLNLIGEGNATLLADNAATRQIRAGVGVVTTAPEPVLNSDVISDPTATSGAPNTTIATKINEKYMRFMRRHFDRAGVMFWAGQPGVFVLGIPNGNQRPTYQFLRRRGLSSNQVNILSAKYKFNTVGRFTECEVHSRNGGRKNGRAKFSGAYVDDEMFNPPLSYVVGAQPLRFHAYRDANVTSVEQAETYARRKAAESRRKGWSLVYEIAGHTCPSLVGGDRAVITPDTVANVVDDELGLSGNFYVESVVYKRSGAGTTTSVTMMRITDLIFGSEDE